jgi:hypothetical protein
MCKAFYTHHRRCGCQILAYKKPCSAGPGSQHCHYHEYALMNGVGSRCRYHEYHNWHPKVHKSPAPIPVETSSSSAGPVPGLFRPVSFEESSSSEESPWVPGEPDIVKAKIVASLGAQGRLGASRASDDADEFSSDSSPPPSPRPGLRYGEGPRGSGPDPEAAYNADDESGNNAADDDDDDEAAISLLQGLIIRRADDRREARRRALIGEELYTRRQNIIRQYQVLREEEKKLEGYKAEYVAACREEEELRRSEESRRALEGAPPNYDMTLDRIPEEIEEDEASPAYVTAKETNERNLV